MEPVTIDLAGLTEWGPYAYLSAYALVTVFLGFIARGHIRSAGATKGDVQASHVASSIVSGLVGIVTAIFTLCSSSQMFDRSIVFADQSKGAMVAVDVYERAVEKRNFVREKLEIAYRELEIVKADKEKLFAALFEHIAIVADKTNDLTGEDHGPRDN